MRGAEGFCQVTTVLPRCRRRAVTVGRTLSDGDTKLATFLSHFAPRSGGREWEAVTARETMMPVESLQGELGRDPRSGNRGLLRPRVRLSAELLPAAEVPGIPSAVSRIFPQEIAVARSPIWGFAIAINRMEVARGMPGQRNLREIPSEAGIYRDFARRPPDTDIRSRIGGADSRPQPHP